MPNLTKLSRTEMSAIASVMLFGVTILISSVGPAQAEDVITEDNKTSPAVTLVNVGYPA